MGGGEGGGGTGGSDGGGLGGGDGGGGEGGGGEGALISSVAIIGASTTSTIRVPPNQLAPISAVEVDSMVAAARMALSVELKIMRLLTTTEPERGGDVGRVYAGGCVWEGTRAGVTRI